MLYKVVKLYYYVKIKTLKRKKPDLFEIKCF